MPKARVHLVLKPSDYPGDPDAETRQDLDALFGHMFPGNPDPAIADTAAAFGVVARIPKLAKALIHVSDYVVKEMEWTSGRRDLQQLMVQAVALHFGADYSFQAHLKPAAAVGITLEMQACIAMYQTANCFSDEQKLVIEYTFAVMEGDVPAELFDRVGAQFGERQAIEFTMGIGWWSMWSMIICATRPEHDFGYGSPPRGSA